MIRGIRKMEIFQDEYDYLIFLTILAKILPEEGVTLHAFCLMTNHVHLLLETGENNIGIFMKRLCGNYARTFNKRNGYKGHLFEDRYKSCTVKDERYFLQVSRYIHLNPVNAGIADQPENYLWSSYRTLVGMEDDHITSVDRTLACFGEGGGLAYREFVR